MSGFGTPCLLTLAEHSSATLNAALSHTVHLLSLLTSYLSLTLPYIPTYPTLPHVGRPSLRANAPLVATTKFRDKHILWMSSKTTPSKLIQFLTSYALLCHSVAYLAWTQGVEGIGIQDVEVKTPATSLLALLFATARSSRLGIRSHESGSLNHLGFGLDVSNVVSAVLDADGSWEESEWDMVER